MINNRAIKFRNYTPTESVSIVSEIKKTDTFKVKDCLLSSNGRLFIAQETNNQIVINVYDTGDLKLLGTLLEDQKIDSGIFGLEVRESNGHILIRMKEGLISTTITYCIDSVNLNILYSTNKFKRIRILTDINYYVTTEHDNSYYQKLCINLEANKTKLIDVKEVQDFRELPNNQLLVLTKNDILLFNYNNGQVTKKLSAPLPIKECFNQIVPINKNQVLLARDFYLVVVDCNKLLFSSIWNIKNGCELFLMALPESKKYRTSDRHYLYLYKENNRIFYEIKTKNIENEIIFLENEDKENQLSKDVKETLKFDQKLAAIQCNDDNIRNKILDITSKRGHTFKNEPVYEKLKFESKNVLPGNKILAYSQYCIYLLDLNNRTLTNEKRFFDREYFSNYVYDVSRDQNKINMVLIEKNSKNSSYGVELVQVTVPEQLLGQLEGVGIYDPFHRHEILEKLNATGFFLSDMSNIIYDYMENDFPIPLSEHPKPIKPSATNQNEKKHDAKSQNPELDKAIQNLNAQSIFNTKSPELLNNTHIATPKI